MYRTSSNKEHSTRLYGISTKEFALISIFSSFWIASQVTLGPIIGSISVGPFTLHGVVNRLVGWLVMLILAEFTGKFGRVSIMASIVAIITRVIRRSASLYVLVVGLGYALGGLAFDTLFFLPFMSTLKGKKRKIYLALISIISGAVASTPYLIYRFSVLGSAGFIALSPIYIQSTVKGVIFSLLGTLFALSFSSRIKPIWSVPKENFETKNSINN